MSNNTFKTKVVNYNIAFKRVSLWQYLKQKIKDEISDYKYYRKKGYTMLGSLIRGLTHNPTAFNRFQNAFIAADEQHVKSLFDADTKALEMAVNKYLRETKTKSPKVRGLGNIPSKSANRITRRSMGRKRGR